MPATPTPRWPPNKVAGLKTDYLIIGSGCSGLAFADTLLDQTDADIVIADRHAKPGGHWNDAYQFVRLHQPSAYYGVNGLELSDGSIDDAGLNKGLLHLASGPQVSAYFESVMERRLLPSGRVRYLPLTEWLGGGRLRGILSGEEQEVSHRRLVDSTYYGTTVPSTHRPKFEVGDGATLVPPNALPALWKRPHAVPSAFVILGAGKTAMDCVAWLLQSGVPQQAIHWVRPRDAWLLNRAKLQPGLAQFETSIGAQVALMTAWAEARDVEDLFDRLEAVDYVLRIDRGTRPRMYHYATSSPAEIALLATVETIIRDGHVRRIESGKLIFENGERAVPEDAMFLDCTATAITRNPPVPLWRDGAITLQMIRIPQPAFSAALTAFIEAKFDDDEKKNALARPIPLPDGIADYPAASLVGMMNQRAWNEEPDVRKWIAGSRLDGFSGMIAGIAEDDASRRDLLKRMRAQGPSAFANLMRLVQAQR
jgi:hypothetical protein